MYEHRALPDEEEDPAWGRYAFAGEAEGFEFLIDPELLGGPARVLVRRGIGEVEIWLDDEVALTRPSRMPPGRERSALELVRERLEELMDLWFHLREDSRRGRLGRNTFTDQEKADVAAVVEHRSAHR